MFILKKMRKKRENCIYLIEEKIWCGQVTFIFMLFFFYKVTRNDCITLNLHSTSPRMDGRTNGQTNQQTDKAGSCCVACD